MEEEPTVEVEVEAETAKTAPKKTIESVVKETFFTEIEALKTENDTLKAELSALKTTEVKEVELKKKGFSLKGFFPSLFNRQAGGGKKNKKRTTKRLSKNKRNKTRKHKKSRR